MCGFDPLILSLNRGWPAGYTFGELSTGNQWKQCSHYHGSYRAWKNEASPVWLETDHKGNISSRWATTMTCGSLAPKSDIWEERHRPHEVVVCCKLAMGKYWTSHIHCNKGVNRFYQSITACSRFGMFVPFFCFNPIRSLLPQCWCPTSICWS